MAGNIDTSMYSKGSATSQAKMTEQYKGAVAKEAKAASATTNKLDVPVSEGVTVETSASKSPTAIEKLSSLGAQSTAVSTKSTDSMTVQERKEANDKIASAKLDQALGKYKSGESSKISMEAASSSAAGATATTGGTKTADGKATSTSAVSGSTTAVATTAATDVKKSAMTVQERKEANDKIASAKLDKALDKYKSGESSKVSMEGMSSAAAATTTPTSGSKSTDTKAVSNTSGATSTGTTTATTTAAATATADVKKSAMTVQERKEANDKIASAKLDKALGKYKSGESSKVTMEGMSSTTAGATSAATSTTAAAATGTTSTTATTSSTTATATADAKKATMTVEERKAVNDKAAQEKLDKALSKWRSGVSSKISMESIPAVTSQATSGTSTETTTSGTSNVGTTKSSGVDASTTTASQTEKGKNASANVGSVDVNSIKGRMEANDKEASKKLNEAMNRWKANQANSISMERMVSSL